jgi:Na+/H+-translocating membrane pyrophosphatase
MAPALYLCCFLSLPSNFKLQNVFSTLFNLHQPWEAYLCTLVGNLSFLAFSFFGFFATNKQYPFVQSLADKCRKGPAAGVTLGLAFGYLGSFIPGTVVILAAFYGF